MRLSLLFASIVVSGLIDGTISDSRAQSLVLEGWTACQRATNGRAYCTRQGSSNFQPVSDEFFARYEAARTGKPVAPPVVVVSPPAQQTTTVNQVVIVGLMGEASGIRGEIALLTKIIEQQKAIARNSADAEDVSETVRILDARLKLLKDNFRQKTVELSKYQTSIKPDDAEMHITARKESETFPKIPYYIPGTQETGEFWVEPYVSDAGVLLFRFQFVDVNSRSANQIRSTIVMSPVELERTKLALIKSAKNSRLAHEKKVRRKIDVRVDCFPDTDCPPEGRKIDNRSSTEVIFSINEDGSTSARIQRNKGRFEEGYNISIGSARLLQAYIHHVLVAGQTEHEIGSASIDELKDMFR